MPTRRGFLALAAATVLASATVATAQDKSIVVSSTTSTQDSGLFGHILPLFKAKTGIDVKVVSQGTGQALDTGRRGDADVVFVHAKSAEEKFLAEGEGVKRYPVMYNDFVLIGPKGDPAGIKGMKDVAKALQVIKDKQADFISRGDRSGTHIAEINLWNGSGIDIDKEKGLGINRSARAWAQHSIPPCKQCLCALGPRHLVIVQEQGRPANPCGRRQAPV